MPKPDARQATKPLASNSGALDVGRPCPVCGSAAVAPHHPFCSARCQDVDLGRWLKGNYAIPGRPAGFGEEDE